jgi:hypothetical protein
MPPLRLKQKAAIVKRSESCAGSRRKADAPKSEKDKTVYDTQWSVSSDSESCDDGECKPSQAKKTRAAKDAAPNVAVEAEAAKDAASGDAVEAVAAKDAGPDKTEKDPSPDVANEAVAAEDAADVAQEPLSPKNKGKVGGRSPSPMKPDRDFVPSSIPSSACASPVNAPTVYSIESLRCNESMPVPKINAAPSVTWNVPLVVPSDGPPSKQRKTSLEGTPELPEN